MNLSTRQREWVRLSRAGHPAPGLLGQLVGELRDDISPSALRSAWQHISATHPELRLQFQWNGGPEPLVRVAPRIRTPWHQENWAELSDHEQQVRRERLLQAERQRPIELTSAPLFRVSLCRQGAGRLWFVWTFHRALLEATASLEIVRELFAHCRHPLRTGPLSASAPHTAASRNEPGQPRESTPLALARPHCNADGPPANLLERQRCQLRLAAATAAALRDLCSRHGIGWTNLMSGLWAVLLGRYSNQDQVVFGLESEGDSTAVAVQVAEDLPVLEWLRQLPAHLLVSQTERASWETVLVGQQNPTRLKLLSPQAQWQFQWLATALEPLRLRVESNHGCRWVAEYDPQRYTAEQIRAVLRQMHNLCAALVATPHQRVAELPLAEPTQRRQTSGPSAASGGDFPLDRPYPELFAGQKTRCPDAVAVRFGDAELTYAALDQWSSQLAGHLQSLGVGPDVPVGVCLPRSLELPVTLLAVLKAGGAYLPLDPQYPPDLLREMLADATAPVVVTRRSVNQSLPLDNLQVVDLQDWRPERSPAAQSCPAGPENLAYLIYTSGSTGKPKGVAIPHRALVNHNCAVGQIYALTATDRVLQFATPNFDLSVEEIFPTWLAGATLVLRPPDLLDSLARLVEFLAREQITVLNLPTAYWHELCRGLDQHPLPATVRLTIIGGEAASLEAYRAWQRCGIPLINTYGPTETTVTATYFRATAADDLPIGRPLPNVQTHVLDQRMRPVPPGVTGELYIGGAGLAHGYWRQPERTAERFVPNPFASGTRLYRTGDLVRSRLDGNLEFVGRTDHQVKWRGYRVELGQIESALCRHAGIGEAIVMVREQKLVAYYLGHGNHQHLAAILRERLPEHMLPTHWVSLEQWPLTPGGKIDRRALPPPGSDQPAPAATNELPALLAKLWAEALGLEQVGLEDNFFQLGGHSLTAMRLVTLIEQHLGRQLTTAELYQAGSAGRLAERLQHPPAQPFASSLVEIQGRGRQRPLYFVHGIGGGLFWGYSNIARHLPDQPVYVFKSRGLDGLAEHEQIETMAAQYVADLRAFQPQGPYQLGGYCFGGTVAYEMARQLQSAGQTVALLALLNCPPTNTDYLHPSPTPWVLLRFLANGLYRASRMAGWSHAQRREFFRWKWQQHQRRRRQTGPSAQQHLGSDDMFDRSAYTPAQRQLWDIHARAYGAYLTRAYYGPVLLLRSRGHPFWCSFDRCYGWRAWIKGALTMHLLPGAHETILREPHVRVLAQRLEQALAASRERSR